jgi:hypothetical protein
VEEQVIAEEKTYRLSRSGRRTAYLMLAGAVLVWIFALWTLKNTLKLGFRPENLGPSLKLLARRLIGAEGTQPLTAEEAIPALIMLVLLVVIPLLIWTIVEELQAGITIQSGGITFRSLGIQLAYPWGEIAAIRPADEQDDEPLGELLLRTSRLSAISNPLVRFLHWQAYGQHKLPLYGGLEERDDLIARIEVGLQAAHEQPAMGQGTPPPLDAANQTRSEEHQGSATTATLPPTDTTESPPLEKKEGAETNRGEV